MCYPVLNKNVGHLEFFDETMGHFSTVDEVDEQDANDDTDSEQEECGWSF